LPKFWQKSGFTTLTRSKHSTDVSVSFVKALLDDSVNEGRAVEQHSLVALKNNGFVSNGTMAISTENEIFFCKSFY
jgi:hypothetical protein